MGIKLSNNSSAALASTKDDSRLVLRWLHALEIVHVSHLPVLCLRFQRLSLSQLLLSRPLQQRVMAQKHLELVVVARQLDPGEGPDAEDVQCGVGQPVLSEALAS